MASSLCHLMLAKRSGRDMWHLPNPHLTFWVGQAGERMEREKGLMNSNWNLILFSINVLAFLTSEPSVVAVLARIGYHVSYVFVLSSSHLITTCSLPIWWPQRPPQTDLKASLQLPSSLSKTKNYYSWNLKITLPKHRNRRKKKQT